MTDAPYRDDSAPLPTVPMCFGCITATCSHRGCGGMIPAITYFKGTALCMDCASATAEGPGARKIGLILLGPKTTP